MKTINIAIDGPSGAGKSTLSRKLAEAFQFIYVDTGALYRAVGLAAIEAGVDIHDAAGIERLLTGLSLELRYTGEGQRVFIGTRDVSGDIRTPEISMAASVVSAQPAVRAFLFALQQDIARGSNVIMDGRDIGTVVLPGADLKIFLTATDEDRAQRRFEELSAKGIAVTYDEVLADMRRRDAGDASRNISPLRPADDAVVLNTTGNSFERSLALLEELVSQTLAENPPQSKEAPLC